MAYWKKRLRTASFRKIRFNLTAADVSFGRRIVQHQFPKRDEPYSEDMGRKAREFTIDAFIQGFDYMRERDRLIKACEQKGPGRLVHPYYGNRDVVCTKCDVREAAGDGGVVRFQLTFAEAGVLKFPQTKKKANSILAFLGAKSAIDTLNQFTDNFTIATYPQYVVDSAQEAVDEFADALEQSTSFITRNSDAVADLAFSISDLRADVDEILHTPEVLATRMNNALGLLREAITGREESLAAYKKIFAYGEGVTFSTISTESRAQLRKNRISMNNAVRQFALAYAIQDISEINFSSRKEAEDSRADFFRVIEEQSGAEFISDDAYQNLQQMRAELANGVPPSDQSLPNVVDITPPKTTNSLQLSFELYGNVDLETDIVERNNLRYPGIIMGGDPVEVLGNG